MMLMGWCESCRKIKNVRVGNAGMMQLARGGTATGQCGACAEAEQKAQRERREARRGR